MKKRIIIAAVIIVSALALTTVSALNPQPKAVQTKPAAEQLKEVKQPENAPTAKIQATERPQDVPQTIETDTHSSQSTAPTAAPQNAEQGGHIPFTNNPVTAGDPQSYVGTVGQCPFHEIAGEKGCSPPPDIECNADWSVCKPKGEIQ